MATTIYMLYFLLLENIYGVNKCLPGTDIEVTDTSNHKKLEENVSQDSNDCIPGYYHI